MTSVRNTLTAVTLLASAGFLGACNSPVNEEGSTVPGRCQSEAPLVEPAKTDILFVIDNSGSMAEEQEAVAVELPYFVEELRKGAGQSHDFQVGVITTSIYQLAQFGNSQDYREFPEESGKLRPVPASEDGSDPGGERILRADDAAMVDKFRRLVRQGTTGSGQETPFEAVRLAVASELATRPLAEGGNGGFLRDGARLLVVIVSDEDDCSELTRPPQVHVGIDKTVDYCADQADKLAPVSAYAEVFRNLRHADGSLREVLWAAIAPVGRSDKSVGATVVDGQLRNVDCPTSIQPGARHKEMASLFDIQLRNLESICQPSYHDVLLDIARAATIRQSLEVHNVPDERLLKVEITRAGGEVDVCTLANGGIRYEPPADTSPALVVFESGCVRRYDDQKVALKMICAG
jgi:hypothetical protein